MELSSAGQEAQAKLLQHASSTQLTPAVAELIKTLWQEQSVKSIYDQRAVMKIEDSSAYFWDEVDRVVDENFIPNDRDILLVRYRTTGVIEQKFEMRRNMFHVFDVGGQKSERKKWIHCFESVTAVIFVAP